MDRIGEHNRTQFDDPSAIDDYTTLEGLTACESELFERHIPAGARVLDLGCGTGRTTPWLHDRASVYLGIDYAPGMIEAARRLHPDADFAVGDAADLGDLADDSFDAAVFAYNGIDYLADADRRRCLDEVRRVMAPGGRFVFSTHNPRLLVISGSQVRGPRARRLAASAYMTLRHSFHHLPQRPFRTGEGWVLDHVRGPLRTHMATPSYVTRELAQHGFTLLDRLNGDWPARPNRLRTPWWYYAAG